MVFAMAAPVVVNCVDFLAAVPLCAENVHNFRPEVIQKGQCQPRVLFQFTFLLLRNSGLLPWSMVLGWSWFGLVAFGTFGYMDGFMLELEWVLTSLWDRCLFGWGDGARKWL